MSKKEQMFDLIEAKQISGLSNIDYCKQNNRSLSVYNYWKKEYNIISNILSTKKASLSDVLNRIFDTKPSKYDDLLLQNWKESL